jgi:hypothetical protein
MSASPPQPAPQKLVWWMLWFAFFQGVPLYRLFLVPKAAPGQPLPPDVIPWGLALLPVLASGILRWNVLPRLREKNHGLLCLVAGIALAEMTCLLAIFLARSHLDLLFAASGLGVLQWAPFYADRFLAPPGGGR